MSRRPGGLDIIVEDLSRLNDRGLEAVGIGATNNRLMWHFLEFGQVRNACITERARWQTFASQTTMAQCIGWLGHVRYPTVGPSELHLAQPFRGYHNVFGEFMLVHNGQLPNHEELRRRMQGEGVTFYTSSDTEVAVALIAASKTDTLRDALIGVVRDLPGAFSLLALNRSSLVAARDRHGMWPLWWQETKAGVSFASEPGGFETKEETLQPVPRGSVIAVDWTADELIVTREDVVQDELNYSCVLNDIYLARDDQVGELPSELETTLQLHWALGHEVLKAHPVQADMLCGIPNSGTAAALGAAKASGVTYRPDMLIRNEYSVRGRTFILPDQKDRDREVKRKFSVTSQLVRGKAVCYVDDTLIRSTTARILTEMTFAAGAREVHWRVAAPMVRHGCYYGMDFKGNGELPAGRMDEAGLCRFIGATSLKFLSLDPFREVVKRYREGSCMACMSGVYPIEIPQ